MAISETEEGLIKACVLLVCTVGLFAMMGYRDETKPANAAATMVAAPAPEARPVAQSVAYSPEPMPEPMPEPVERGLPPNFLQLVMQKLPDCESEAARSRVQSIFSDSGIGWTVVSTATVRVDAEKLKKVCSVRFRLPNGRTDATSFQVEWTDVANGKYNVRLFERN